MKKIALAVVCIGTVFAAGPLKAQNAARSGTEVEQAALKDPIESAQRDDETVVCRNLAPKVGTRIPGRRVCLTMYQWEEWEQTTRETARDVEMRGRLYKN